MGWWLLFCGVGVLGRAVGFVWFWFCSLFVE